MGSVICKVSATQLGDKTVGRFVGLKTLGDAEIVDEATYHFASGYDGYVRNTPDRLTQDFLATLPEKWRKHKLELSTSGINEDAPSDEELAERGLAPKVRNVWSLVEAD